jgi:hypothetical protein
MLNERYAYFHLLAEFLSLIALIFPFGAMLRVIMLEADPLEKEERKEVTSGEGGKGGKTNFRRAIGQVKLYVVALYFAFLGVYTYTG